MNIYAIPNIAGSICLIILGVFAYLKNPRSRVNKSFALMCLSGFVWLFLYALAYLSRTQQMAYIFLKIGYVGVIFIPATAYHFMVTFLNIKDKRALTTSYFFVALFTIFHIFTPFFMNGTYKYFWGYYPKVSFLHPLYLIYLVIIVLRGIGLLFWSLQKNSGFDVSKRNQIKYVIAAMFLLCFATEDFIQNYGVQIYPFGFIFILGFCGIVAYAIISHQLLDIAVVVKKTVVFAGLFTFVYMVFAAMAYIGQDMLRNMIGVNYWIAIVPSVLIMIVALKPLESALVNVTDKYLFQKKYDYKELLKTFTMGVLSVLDINELLEIAVINLKEIMKIDSSAIYLFERKGRGIKTHRCAGFSVKAKDIVIPENVISAFKSGKAYISIDGGKDIPAGASGAFVADSPELIIPLVLRDRLVAILTLGKKKSDEAYTKDDLDILLPIAKTMAIAISNAELFEELRRIQAEAAQKEKMAMIGTLAAGMAHEIRNPIMTIRTFADYLPEKYTDENFVKTFNRIIPTEIEKIDNIAYSLLEFSGVEERVTDEDVDLRDVMRIVISVLEPQYKFSGIKISLADKYSGTIAARANKREIQGSFFNIIKYAMSETPKGGEVSVEMSREDDKSIWVSVKAKNITVAEHVIKDVFEPMSRLYKEKRGFGFNLFIAKQLLERNGGVLTIRSDREMGSEFKMYFKNISV